MITYDANLQLAFDLVGVFVFALSGGLVAVKKRLDLFGVLVLAGAAALGGGVLRDILIGARPPVGISDWRLICSAVLRSMSAPAEPEAPKAKRANCSRAEACSVTLRITSSA